jgi:hypothetical protein
MFWGSKQTFTSYVFFFETGKQADSDHILDEIALGTQQFCNALQFFVVINKYIIIYM